MVLSCNLYEWLSGILAPFSNDDHFIFYQFGFRLLNYTLRWYNSVTSNNISWLGLEINFFKFLITVEDLKSAEKWSKCLSEWILSDTHNLKFKFPWRHQLGRLCRRSELQGNYYGTRRWSCVVSCVCVFVCVCLCVVCCSPLISCNGWRTVGQLSSSIDVMPMSTRLSHAAYLLNSWSYAKLLAYAHNFGCFRSKIPRRKTSYCSLGLGIVYLRRYVRQHSGFKNGEETYLFKIAFYNGRFAKQAVHATY